MENKVFKKLDCCCYNLANIREDLDCYNLLSEDGKERLNALETELYELMYDKDGIQRRYRSEHKLNKNNLIEAIINEN